MKVRNLPWVLFALALATSVVFALLWQRAESEEERREQVEEVARSFLAALTNFSGDRIEEDVEEIRSFAVGEFADQVETFFGPEAVTALREARAVSVGDVRSVFVQRLSGDTASVFGVVDESVTNATSETPRTETLRVDMQMIETASGWRVSRVSILQTQAETPFGGG